MTKLFVTSLILSFASLATQAQTAAVEPAASLPCDLEAKGVQADGTDLVVFKCPVQATGAVQRLKFRADLLGSHDDTTASISTQLNGTLLACEEGSKTDTSGEFGEVSLDCKFQIKEQAGNKLLLDVKLKIFHARYFNADFVMR